MERRVAVRGVIVFEGKLFCVRLKAYDGKKATDFWATPGGGVDPGEALIPALTREIIEEVGVEPVVGNLLYVQQFEWHDLEQMEFFFHIQNAKDYLSIDLASTTHGSIEIEEAKFIDASQNNVLPKFLQTEDFSNLANQPTKYFNYL